VENGPDRAASAGARRRPLGPYDLLDELGRGGMGIVYRARHRELGREVALKTLLPGFADRIDLARFEREARAASGLADPHVVRVLDFGRDAGVVYLAMELVPGESLQRRVERTGPLPSDRAAWIAAQVARGLAAAHARGLIHRDVKPANVLLRGEDEALLADFGLAKDLAAGGERLTATGELLGTPAYMAPEQALGGPVDARTDVYGVAATLYFALTGRPPHQQATAIGTLESIATRAPTPPRAVRPDVAPAVEAACLAGLARAPADRPATCGELARTLERVGGRTRRGLDRAPAGARRGSAAALIAALAAAVVVALGTGAWWTGRAGAGAGDAAATGEPPAPPPDGSAAPPQASPPPSTEAAALLAAARERRAEGNDDAAVDLLARAIALAERRDVLLDAIALRGEVRLRRGEHGPALEDGRLIEELRPDDPRGHVLVARGLIGLGAPAARIEAAVARAHAGDDPPAAAYSARAWLRFGQGRPREALADLDAAAERDPGHALAWTLRGSILLSLGRSADARAALERGLELDPHDAGGWFNLGKARRATGAPDGALDAFARANELDPELAIAWDARGRTLIERGALADGLACLDRAIAVAPDDVDFRIARADALLDSAGAAGAFADLDRVLALEPDHPDGLALRAEAHYRAGDRAAAEADFERLRARHPNHPAVECLAPTFDR